MREVLGDSTRGGEWAAVRLRVDGDRIVEADAPGLEREIPGLTLLEAAAVGGETLAVDALANALGPVFRAAPVPGRTVVAMSGGVDSAVAALILARDHAPVVGVTLELWGDAENDGERSCCSAQAVRGAREAAHRLGVPHFSIDLREEFRAGVVDHWLEGHAAGETPNPCVRCNGNVRLEAMLDLGRRLGSETLVTGHYARVEGDLLRLAVDPVKDQSYVLSGLAPESLARLRFPLGDMHKAQVRELAEREGLAVARKPDSQDLCFLAGTGLTRFLERHGELEHAPGSIVDLEGHELGVHRGSRSFTIGQRHGLGLGGGEPLYVLDTDATANTVTVGPREALLTDTVRVREVTLRRPGAVWIRRCGRGVTRISSCALSSRSSARRPGRWRACSRAI
jgi:tRNA-uridine 2-sulfurtransferase